ncbi:MAG TPA: hypothetical protein VJ576_01145 [Rhodocyclaceae bacterium]|nr:hypothetical protein [Rhodocyclaceae bacterium]
MLQQITPPPGHLTAYIVGSAWLPKALERFEKTHGFLIDYPYPRTAIPFSAYGSHSHQVQLIALAQFNQRYGQIIAERVLRKQSTKEAVPDFIFRVRGKVEWHEVELSPKYTERLFFQLQERESARRAGRFTKLVWWCARPGIADNLTAALNRERIPYVQRRGDGRIVRDDTMEGWNPAQLRKASKILLVDDMKSDPVEFNNCRINFSEPIKQEGFA